MKTVFQWAQRSIFILMNLGALCIIAKGLYDVAQWFQTGEPLNWSWSIAGATVGFYFARMFAITGGYHRYFSHRTYKMHRPTQAAVAVLGCSAMQKGPIWWASHHRDHHQFSDKDGDPHSPIRNGKATLRGILWAHIGWVVNPDATDYDKHNVKDLLEYPELRFLDEWHFLPGFVIGGLIWMLWGWTAFAYIFIVGTFFLYHATFLINSICHVFGSRPYDTPEFSRNNWIAALWTMGEGWHNNHHHLQNVCRQGRLWWQLDMTYYILRGMRMCGLVWHIKEPPTEKKETKKVPAAAGAT